MEDPRRDAVVVIGALVTRPTLQRQAEVIRRCFSPRVHFTHFLVDVASGAADLTCIYQVRWYGVMWGEVRWGGVGVGWGDVECGVGRTPYHCPPSSPSSPPSSLPSSPPLHPPLPPHPCPSPQMAHVVLQYQGVRVHRVLYDPQEDALTLYVTVFTRTLFKLSFLAHFDLCVLLELEDIPLVTLRAPLPGSPSPWEPLSLSAPLPVRPSPCEPLSLGAPLPVSRSPCEP
ncbi:unnamed protein product [Closterium sp. NIES-54]